MASAGETVHRAHLHLCAVTQRCSVLPFFSDVRWHVWPLIRFLMCMAFLCLCSHLCPPRSASGSLCFDCHQLRRIPSLFAAAFARSPCTLRRPPTPRRFVGPTPLRLPAIGSFRRRSAPHLFAFFGEARPAFCAAAGQLHHLPSAAVERRSHSSLRALSTAAARRSILHSSRKALSWLPSSWPAPASWRTSASWAWTPRTKSLSVPIVSFGRQTRAFRASNCRLLSQPRRHATKVAST